MRNSPLPAVLPPTRRGLTLLEVLVVLLILGLLAAVCMPAILHSREVSRRNQCKDHLKQLGIALHTYHNTYKVFPYASTFGLEVPYREELPSTSTDGHNWVGLILPFMNQSPLYQRLDFHVGYHDPANWRTLETAKFSLLGCPSNAFSTLGRPVHDPKSAYNPASFTGIPHGAASQGLDYALCAGSTCPGTMPPDVPPEHNIMSSDNRDYLFDPAGGSTVCPDSTPIVGVPTSWYQAHRVPRSIPGMATRGVTKLGVRDCPDGTSNVILAGERLSQEIAEGALWSNITPVAHTNMRPNSPNRAPGAVSIFAMNGGYASHHEKGVNVLMVDGTTQLISNNIDRLTYSRLGDRSDGATLDNAFCNYGDSQKNSFPAVSTFAKKL